jgi:hypothetical protein
MNCRIVVKPTYDFEWLFKSRNNWQSNIILKAHITFERNVTLMQICFSRLDLVHKHILLFAFWFWSIEIVF